MPEAVIVATARSPIGRAFKGSLVDVRPDDLAATIVQAALDKLPGLDPATLDDLMLGCAEPEGKQGVNMARRVAVALGYDCAAGHDGEPVLRLVGPDLADGLPRHQGRRGPRLRLRRGRVRLALPGVRGAGGGREEFLNPLFDEARARTEATAASNEPWHDPRQDGLLPDVYIAMGQTAENLATSRGISRADQDEFGVRSQNLAEKAIADGFFDREIVPITTPDGTVVRRDDGPRPGVTLEGVAGLRTVFREDGTVTAGNCCPLNDGAAAVVIMSDSRAAELGVTPLARIVSTGVSALSPEIMGLGPVEASRRALALAGLASTTSTWSRSTRRSRPRSSRPTGTWGSTSTGSTSTVARSLSVTRSAPPEPGSRPRCSTASSPATRSWAWRRCASAAGRAWRWSSSA